MIDRVDEAATVAATNAASTQRIEIVSDRRRAHDPAFRARVVADSYIPGTQVRELARRHGICASLVYRWRREHAVPIRGGSSLELVPVRVVDETRVVEKPSDNQSPAPSVETPRKSASIEIEFAGGVRVRVDETVSQAALRRVVAVLRG